jgi:hypothetical protein
VIQKLKLQATSRTSKIEPTTFHAKLRDFEKSSDSIQNPIGAISDCVPVVYRHSVIPSSKNSLMIWRRGLPCGGCFLGIGLFG